MFTMDTLSEYAVRRSKVYYTAFIDTSSRDSGYFSTRFAQLGIRDHEALPTIISLRDVECKGFDAPLLVLSPE